MSGTLESVGQLGFVVHDLDRALEYWTKTFGVVPFLTIRNVVPGSDECFAYLATDSGS